MPYYIKKQGLSGRMVYWCGESVWSDDRKKSQGFPNTEMAENTIKNPDGKNGGVTGAVVIEEELE